jgi:hypothetical protein
MVPAKIDPNVLESHVRLDQLRPVTHRLLFVVVAQPATSAVGKDAVHKDQHGIVFGIIVPKIVLAFRR